MLSCILKVFFLSFLTLFSYNVVQTWFVSTKLTTQHYLVYIVVSKWYQSKTIVICLKLRAKLHFKCFLIFFGTFSCIVVQTWFVCHETCDTTLICIYCCVEMVTIEKNIHMLEITCSVACLRFFKRFLYFLH